MITIASPIITKSLTDDIKKVIESGMWTQGNYVKELENSLEKKLDVRHAIVVSSGTAALHTLLSAFSFKPTDEIITTPFTFVASVNAIILSGAKPVFADISVDDFNIDPLEIEKKITTHTKAILTTDLYGQSANYKVIQDIAKKHKLYLLADSAQAIGALHYNKPPVFYADVSVLSLYATKNIASGEGGVILTNNDELANFSRSFRNQGQSNNNIRYSYERVGLNYRLTDIQAVIALDQLVLLNKIIEKRTQIAKYYNERLRKSNIILPKPRLENRHVFHQYTIRVNPSIRERLQRELSEEGIQTAVYYPQPLHLISHLKPMGYHDGDFPISEQVSREVLSLPIHYNLKKGEQKLVVDRLLSHIQ
jgi:dTDP-4-amino-4,6-dideoxygalactose transaminase